MRRPLALTLAGLVVAAGFGAIGQGAAVGGGNRTGSGWRPRVRAAERYARRRAGEVRFAIVGLDGRMDRFHARRTAPAASVFKVMLLATYLRQPSVRHRHLHPGDRDLLRPMIRRSDNLAATRVNDVVGGNAIEDLAHAAGMRDFTYDPSVWGLSRTSPRDQARFMEHLERYIPRRHEHYARRLLSSIVPSQRWGIAEVEPPGWKLYFKSGWGSGTGRVDHQVAFLDRGVHRVALAIFTEFDPSHAYGEHTERGVAKRLLRGLPRLPKHP
jgi:beta-lactamase class A